MGKSKKEAKLSGSKLNHDHELLETTEEKIDHYKERKQIAMQGGGAERIKAQHDKGKFTARERLTRLLDPGTFVETGMFISHKAVGLLYPTSEHNQLQSSDRE